MRAFLLLVILVCPCACATTYDIFLPVGQSNSDGAGNIVQTTHPPNSEGNLACFMDPNSLTETLNPLQDPVQESYLQNTPTSSGSMWPAFGHQYFLRSGTPVVVCGGARNSQGLTSPYWQDDAQGLMVVANKFSSAVQLLAAQGNTVGHVVMIWNGGESDVGKAMNGTMTQQQWHDLLVAFLGRARAKLGLPDMPLLIVSIDNCSKVYTNTNCASPDQSVGYAVIRAAQAQAAADTPGIWLAVPYQHIEDQGWIIPNAGPHWNQLAQNTDGALLGVAADEILNH